uniref:F-box C protein n=1 Tax=Caenorhabditis tropicalis TaxID=1561998 RepID=A0A1I7TGN6_9PELO
MSSRQMSYDSLKSIMKYTEVNKRIEMANGIPCMLTPDRVTAISIDKLILQSNMVTIDDTSYRFGIVRQNKNGPTPRRIQEANENGGLQQDIDEFGFFDSQSEIPNMETTEKEMLQLKGKLESIDIQLKYYTKSTGYRNQLIEESENILLTLTPILCRLDGVPSPFEPKIQLTTTKGLKKKVELVKYNKKLPQAMKYLTTKMFGKRRNTVRVRSLEIGSEQIQLPENLKLDVKELRIEGNVRPILDTLAPIIQNSDLDVFKCVSLKSEDLEVEAVRTARSLMIGYLSFGENWMTIFEKLENQKVHLETDLVGFSEENYSTLISHWIEVGKPIGTSYSFGIVLPDMIEGIKRSLMDRFGGFVIKRQNSNIVVDFEKKEGGLSPWLVSLKITE